MLDNMTDRSLSGSSGGSTSGAFAGYARAAVSVGLQMQQPLAQSVASSDSGTDGEKKSTPRESDSGSDCSSIGQHPGPTYASVVRAQPQLSAGGAGAREPGGQPGNGDNGRRGPGAVGDPFAVLRTLGSRGSDGTNPGLYRYFS